MLSDVVVTDLRTGDKTEIPAAGMFFAIGHEPNVTLLDSQIEVDDDSFILAKPVSTAKMNISGIFAAGDVQEKRWRQAITAAGTGAMAALEVEE